MHKKSKEVEDIRQVLDDLEQALKTELRIAERVPQQLDLFSEDERTQLRVAIDLPLSRLVSLAFHAETRAAKRQAIEERHSNAIEHTFPVAVILLVPESLATGRRG